MFGLVLPGGAARGAWQAGALRFVFTELAPRLGPDLWPEVVSGTSVGALNGVFTAARDREGVGRISAQWRELSTTQVYDLGLRRALQAFASTFRDPAPGASVALLDARPLRTLVARTFPRASLRRAIDSGATHAMYVTATDLVSGRTTTFADLARGNLPFRPLPSAVVRRARIQPRHALASAAIPFLFPSIPVQGRLYVDGGLRHNTPLRPVLLSGCDRVLVIAPKLPTEQAADLAPHTRVTPTLPFLAGKSLNALMLDPVERDLRMAERLNEVVDWGVARFGPEFATEIAADLGLRRVETTFLVPSTDLGVLAADAIRKDRVRAPWRVQLLLRVIGDRANAAESDLLSYLLFDKVFTAPLEALGFEDARRREEELARLLAPRRGAGEGAAG